MYIDSKDSQSALTLRPVASLIPRWTNETYDDEIDNAIQHWYADVIQLTHAFGMDNQYVNFNFAGKFQNPLASYGAENLDFMRQVAAKYDPEHVFQQLVPGGFKLSKAGIGRA